MKRKLLLVLAMMLAFSLCALALCACNANHSDTNHKWSEGIVVKQPTCTEEGTQVFLCIVCGISKTEPISALGHTLVTDSAVEPTCTQSGLTEGSHCSVCNAVLVAQQTISATGHTLSAEWSTGEMSHWRACTVCNVKPNEASHVGTTANCEVCGAQRPATEGIAYEIVGDHAEVVGVGIATDSDIVLESTCQGLQVTVIRKEAFRDCSSLTSVVIPNSVTSIGDEAFSGCSSLTSVVIPNSVTTIGCAAFRWCSSFTSIIIPDSVTSIGDEAFSGCSSLTSVVIPNSVTTIGEFAYCNCSSLTSIVIPDSVTTIGAYAFYGCISLTSIVIPNSVTTIGIGAFSGCSSLTSIVIPDSVTTIGAYAFYGCISLTSIVIPNSVTTIGNSAFSGCISLTSVVIPDSVTTIGDYAFSGCRSLKDIYCEATSQPSGWNSGWKGDCSATVHWGYEG